MNSDWLSTSTSRFTRKISFVEALTGVNFTIKHLNGKTVRVKSEEGKITIVVDKITICISQMLIKLPENNICIRESDKRRFKNDSFYLRNAVL